MSSTVQVGAPTDTAPTYTVTLTRDAADTVTDYTTISSVVLILPDATTKTVTKTSATTSTWIGTVRYNAWWTTSDVFMTKAKATFADATVMTFPDPLNFSVGVA